MYISTYECRCKCLRLDSCSLSPEAGKGYWLLALSSSRCVCICVCVCRPTAIAHVCVWVCVCVASSLGFQLPVHWPWPKTKGYSVLHMTGGSTWSDPRSYDGSCKFLHDENPFSPPEGHSRDRDRDRDEQSYKWSTSSAQLNACPYMISCLLLCDIYRVIYCSMCHGWCKPCWRPARR